MSVARNAWERFWFAPIEASTLALFRIGFGLVALAWTLTLAPSLYAFYGEDGVLPARPGAPAGAWSVFDLTSSDLVVTGLYLTLLVASLCLLVGFRARLAAVVVWACLVSFGRRDPWVLNSGDLMLTVLAFYLMLAPSGAALSVDSWLRAPRRFWEFSTVSAWPLRLIQVQVSILYFFAVWAKLRGTTWSDGTAASYAFRIEDLERFPVPAFVTDSLPLVNLMTYGTLAVELALAFLIWNQKLRPWVLLAGVALHLSIDFSVRVGFFSLVALVAYLSFLPPATARAWIYWARDRAPRGRRGAAPTSRVLKPGLRP